MTTYCVNAADMARKMVVDLRATKKDLERALFVAAVRGIRSVTQTIGNTKPFPPVDRGMYRMSWQAEQIQEGGILFSDAPYAGIIESGARPHFPPIAPLIEWCKRKMTPRLTKQFKAAGGQKVLGKSKGDYIEAQTKSMAYAVAKTIARRGLSPKKILQNTIPELERIALEEMERVCRGA